MFRSTIQAEKIELIRKKSATVLRENRPKSIPPLLCPILTPMGVLDNPNNNSMARYSPFTQPDTVYSIICNIKLQSCKHQSFLIYKVNSSDLIKKISSRQSEQYDGRRPKLLWIPLPKILREHHRTSDRYTIIISEDELFIRIALPRRIVGTLPSCDMQSKSTQKWISSRIKSHRYILLMVLSDHSC